ncbi:MAG: tRNA-dihydrouridine synthase B [Arenicella sp.]|jgi:tRNA-dihydrouridine synthase B
MAGVSDKPYRQVCRAHGAGLVVSEMITSQLDLRHTTKSKFRLDLAGEPGPVVVQLVGTEPTMLAEAAQYNVANGAQIIDINMGCPAKKVCKKAAGSALLGNEALVAEILQTVVAAVDVPVTVKIRTGTTPETRNAPSIARIAEDAGVSAITIHGRTRECKFVGEVEYNTIAEVKRSVSVPIIANGDINSPEIALRVMNATNADAVMVGRAAQGQPWLFQQIADFLETGRYSDIPDAENRAHTIIQHHSEIHQFYGESLGLRLARKHIKWYLANWSSEITPELKTRICTTENASEQRLLLKGFLRSSCSQLAA